MKKFVVLTLVVGLFVSVTTMSYAVDMPKDSRGVSLEALILTRTLKHGQRHEEVKKLQQYLIDHGFLTDKADGAFGLKTKKAVMLLQKLLGLTADGVIGPKTQKIFKELKGEVTKKKVSLVPGCTADSLFSPTGLPCDGGKGSVGSGTPVGENADGTYGTPSDPGKNPDDDKKNQETDYRCLDGAGAVALNASLLTAPTGTPTYVVTTTGGVTNASWVNFKLENPTDCPTKVSKMQVKVDTNDVSNAWPPVQSVKLMHGSTQLATTQMYGGGGTTYLSGTVTSTGTHLIGVGSTAGLEVGNMVKIEGSYLAGGSAHNFSATGTITSMPSGVTMNINITTSATILTGATALSGMVYVVGPRVLTFELPAYAVTIGAHSSQNFAVVANSQNVTNTAGIIAVTAAGGVTFTGTPTFFSLQLVEVKNTSTLGGVVNDQIAPTTLPSTIISPIINIYM